MDAWREPGMTEESARQLDRYGYGLGFVVPGCGPPIIGGLCGVELTKNAGKAETIQHSLVRFGSGARSSSGRAACMANVGALRKADPIACGRDVLTGASMCLN